MRDLTQLLAILDQAYDKRSWHGTNLRGSIRGLSAQKAAWRPARGRHNIWELVVHAAYWKYVVQRRLSGKPRGSFPLKGSNWFERPTEGTELAWRADVLLLEQTHRALRDVVAKLTQAQLGQKIGEGKNAAWLISGAAAHDLYHTGQIQLLKTLSGLRAKG